MISFFSLVFVILFICALLVVFFSREWAECEAMCSRFLSVCVRSFLFSLDTTVCVLFLCKQCWCISAMVCVRVELNNRGRPLRAWVINLLCSIHELKHILLDFLAIFFLLLLISCLFPHNFNIGIICSYKYINFLIFQFSIEIFHSIELILAMSMIHLEQYDWFCAAIKDFTMPLRNSN